MTLVVTILALIVAVIGVFVAGVKGKAIAIILTVILCIAIGLLFWVVFQFLVSLSSSTPPFPSTNVPSPIPSTVPALPPVTFTFVPFTPVPVYTVIPTTISSTPTLSIKPPVQATTSPKDGMVMVYVPAGPFQMGGGDSLDAQPIHMVILNAFWIDQTDITNAMYAKCVQDSKCIQPSNTDHYNDDSNYTNHPVVYVSWSDANAYCSWAGRQLPTEAQWEKAARGTDGRLYPWGNVAGCALANYFGKGNGSGSDFCVGDTTEVRIHPDGVSFYGAYDMAGNVWQWVNDWYDSQYYETLGNNAQNPQGPASGVNRVLRGGSWNSWEPYIRSVYRWNKDPFYSNNDIGFRCAMSQ